jgi:Ca-activated chloride channel family protein
LERKVVHFEHSQILWLAALVVPLLSLFLGWAWRRRRERVTRFIHANLVEQLTLGLSAARRKAKLALLLGVVLLLFIALARPKVGYTLQKTETRSLDILVAVDTSRSMLATDQSPNRLERAKLAVLDLMRLAKRDRLGLIAFSGSAFLQCPLTIDRNAFIQNVNSLNTDIIPQGGTAIGEAVTEALRTFEKEEDNHKVLVLMTDGEDHEAGVTDAAQKANKIGMKIFTIGLGSTEGELIQLPDPQTGRLEFLKDASGNVIKSRLNETLLRTLSTDTGAFYLPLQGADTMERLYEAGLAGLTPNRIENQMTKRYIERYQWPLGLAIFVIISEMLLRESRRKPLTNRASTGVAATALGLLLLAPVALATPAEARRAMEQDDFGRALRLYEKLLEDSPEDARLHYNAGAAAYGAGDFEKARNYFNSTLASPDTPLPLQQRAFYNLGNAMFRLGATTENPDDKAKQWIGALKKYEGAFDLSKQLEKTPDDEDARFNTDVVKKRLEQLKQQQQQQQQQGDDKQDKENQDKNEQKKDQQQKKSDDQKKQDQQQQQKDQQQQEDQQKGDEEKKEQQQQSGQKQEEKKKEQQKKDSSGGEDKKEQSQPKPGEEQSNAGQAQPDGKMTPEQVRQLLDTIKQQERIYRPAQKGKARNRGITKNW